MPHPSQHVLFLARLIDDSTAEVNYVEYDELATVKIKDIKNDGGAEARRESKLVFFCLINFPQSAVLSSCSVQAENNAQDEDVESDDDGDTMDVSQIISSRPFCQPASHFHFSSQEVTSLEPMEVESAKTDTKNLKKRSRRGKSPILPATAPVWCFGAAPLGLSWLVFGGTTFALFSIIVLSVVLTLPETVSCHAEDDKYFVVMIEVCSNPCVA